MIHCDLNRLVKNFLMTKFFFKNFDYFKQMYCVYKIQILKIYIILFTIMFVELLQTMFHDFRN